MHSPLDTPMTKLNNGILMPQLGLGVYQVAQGEEVEQAVTHALRAGYRHIDTASYYGNEEGVGKAIADSGIPREEIFVTTKLWNDDQGAESTKAALTASLERLGLEYVDLYLIHWPVPSKNQFLETWRAMEDLYNEGHARAIGVSNFKPHHLADLLDHSHIVPAVNQIELHPMMSQLDTREYCKEKGIAIESWSPLMQAGELLKHPIITEIADAHSKEPAQIVLRWHIQSGLIVIPKSVTPKRIESNIAVFDFKLSGEEMKQIDGLNQDHRIGPDPDKM